MKIDETRIQPLNRVADRRGDYVLYWMQQSQREEYNHALEYAVQQANAQRRPLLVVFGLMGNYPEANARHYTFMLEGLQETQSVLAERGIKMVIQKGVPSEVALAMGKRASLIICDRGYLRHQKAWRCQVAQEAHCPVVQVESDVIVPVEVVSSKAEYAARTIRPKILAQADQYFRLMRRRAAKKSSLNLDVPGLNLDDINALVAQMPIDHQVQPVTLRFKGGTSQAKQRFRVFLRDGLARYDRNSNQPQTDHVSHMSMYLHFGQISPVYLALRIKKALVKDEENRTAYLEQLIVRRELAVNFVHYTSAYDAYSALPAWARKTLEEHKKDRRNVRYGLSQLEDAQTHDEYWNAAMNEMKYTGFMHNYMRMYWGKKILQWSDTPEEAYRIVLQLNNKYFVDGRDPNSYVGVAWLFGLHDRAWQERPVFGKVRYMAASGLERKCDIGAYVRKVNDRMRQMQGNP